MRYDQIFSTEFGRANTTGGGGNAGDTLNTGGKGGFLFVNVTVSTVLSYVLGSNGIVPGGGAGTEVIGPAGGNGLVVIYF